MDPPSLAGPALLAAALGPPQLLAPYCTTTTTVALPAITSINTITWTYKGPAPGQPTSPFVLEPTTTYKIVVPTRESYGGSGPQTYTIIGPPLGEPSQCLSTPKVRSTLLF